MSAALSARGQITVRIPGRCPVLRPLAPGHLLPRLQRPPTEPVALPFSCQQPINRETVILARQYQDKEHQCEPRNHMRVKLVKGFSQKMAESDNGQNEAESDQCLTHAEAQNY